MDCHEKESHSYSSALTLRDAPFGSLRVHFTGQACMLRKRARACWALMDETEKAAVRTGRTPFWAMCDDLGGMAPGDGWEALSGNHVRQLADALAEIVKGEADGRDG